MAKTSNKAEANKKSNTKAGKVVNTPKITDKKTNKLSSQTKPNAKKTKTISAEQELETPISSEELEQAILAGFSVKKITALEKKTSDKKIPNRILLIFIFSLVLLLFAFYKIALQGFQPTKKDDLNSPSKQKVQYEENTQGVSNGNEGVNNSALNVDQTLEGQGGEIIEIDTSTPDTSTSPENEMQTDLQIISSFYVAFGQVDVEGMNRYVDTGLKNTSVWQQFWSQKNINTFVGNVHDTLSLENLFFIAGSTDELKKTRQYSYEISYILNSNQSFREDRVITLRDTPEGTKVAAIKCESNKCSSSPFFWPQNYGLK